MSKLSVELQPATISRHVRPGIAALYDIEVFDGLTYRLLHSGFHILTTKRLDAQSLNFPYVLLNKTFINIRHHMLSM